MAGSAPVSVPPSRGRSKRPLYLVIALVLVWMVGVFGATEGCQTIEVLHRPEAVRVGMNRISDMQLAKRQEALINTVLEFRKTVTPLAIGQLLLGTLLTLTAGLTLLGRTEARKLALQAIVVYALFLPLDYVMRRPMRAVAIDAISEGVTFSPTSGGTSPELADLRIIYWWAYRGALGLQLAVLSMGLVALTRPRVRAFFARSAERAREPEP
ncbi:MAG TPA: hypothetical protein VF881_06915 [Polyangiaceae bacterium]